jgi:hypothetical protein
MGKKDVLHILETGGTGRVYVRAGRPAQAENGAFEDTDFAKTTITARFGRASRKSFYRAGKTRSR